MDINNIMYEAFSKFSNQEIIDQLEKIRWPDRVVSPFDSSSKVYRCKHCTYKCKNTKKYFTVKTGTILSNTKLPLFKWMYTLHTLTQKGRGLSSYQYARNMRSTQKTGWYTGHKIRVAMSALNQQIDKLKGVVEIDEAHVGGKNINRHFDKKYINSQGRSNQDKTQVLGMVERTTGQLRAYVVPDTSQESLEPVILRTVDRSSIVMTDDWKGYNNLKKFFKHLFISKYDVDGEENAHTNTIENSWRSLKQNYKGMYFKMDRYHVQKYVDEWVFRYNTLRLTDGDRLIELLKLIAIPVLYKDIRMPWHPKISFEKLIY